MPEKPQRFPAAAGAPAEASRRRRGVTFTIYRDTNNDGSFNPAVDTKISDEVSFSQASGQGYTLVTPQTITGTAQRFFVVYNLAPAAALSSVGAQILDETYFTVAAGNVNRPDRLFRLPPEPGERHGGRPHERRGRFHPADITSYDPSTGTSWPPTCRCWRHPGPSGLTLRSRCSPSPSWRSAISWLAAWAP